MWFRSYNKRNRLINAFMLEAFEELEIQDNWTARLVFLEQMKIEWDRLSVEDPELRPEFLKFQKALDEEIAHNLDHCIATSCPR